MGARTKPTKTVSRSEVAFCGIGTASMAEHELSIMDVPAYLGGKLSKGVCKLAHLVTDEDRDRNKYSSEWTLLGFGS